MKQRLKLLFLISIAVVLSLQSSGQSILLRPSINIIPPYSVYLPDYVSSTSNKLNVSIVVNDPNPQELSAKLKFTILSDGISITTRPDFKPSPIRISTGVNVLTSADLVPYFDAAALNFQGMDKGQFIKSGRLKEGIYQFCVEVVEYERGIRLSERACATAWLLLNNPPLWNIPANNEIVRASNPQNLLFNWTPQHTGSPNSAFTAEYEFTLVEVWPIQRNPNDAINAQVPLYRTTTTSNSLIYGPTEPQLIPGRKYAIRLRAYDREGRDLFVNNGYSEVRVFTFGEECKYPTSLSAKVENFQKAKVTYVSQSSNTEFIIRYRPYGGNADDPWYTKRSIFPYAILDSLKEGVKYEYSIKAGCESLTSDFSPIDTFSLPRKPDNSFECKEEERLVEIQNKTPKAILRTGERINIGGYDVELTEVKGSEGTFSGKGTIVIPFMNNIKVKTYFTNITVNTDNVVTAGNIEVEKASLQIIDDQTKDKIYETLTNVDQKFNDINKYLDKTNNIIQEVDKVITEVPKESRELMEKGKNMIEQGKQLIASGNTEKGKELIEQGKKEIKEGVNKALNGGGSTGTGGTIQTAYNNIKDYIESILQESKIKDSTERKTKEESWKTALGNKTKSTNDITQTRDEVAIGQSKGETGKSTPVNHPEGNEELIEDEIAAIKKDEKYKMYFDVNKTYYSLSYEMRALDERIKVILYLLQPGQLDELKKEIESGLTQIGKDAVKDLKKGNLPKETDEYIKNYLTTMIDKRVKEALQK